MLPGSILLHFQKVLLRMTSDLQTSPHRSHRNQLDPTATASCTKHRSLSSQQVLHPAPTTTQKNRAHTMQDNRSHLSSDLKTLHYQLPSHSPRPASASMPHLLWLPMSYSTRVTRKLDDTLNIHLRTSSQSSKSTCITVLDPTKASIFFQSRSNLCK